VCVCTYVCLCVYVYKMIRFADSATTASLGSRPMYTKESVSKFVYAYVCIHVNVYICIYMYICVCVYVRMYVCMFV